MFRPARDDMKKWLCLLLYLFIAHAAISAERWAIIVGIGNYPEGSGWKSINGDQDIGLIAPILQSNGFAESRIITLANDDATKRNIQNAIDSLALNLRQGDIVYFHFSGHGQLITDIDGDEGDYGYDESIVPYDAKTAYDSNGYRGENHIIDDELNGWLMDIRKRIGNDGKLIVVLDACHSGGGSRDEDDDDNEETIRGVRDVFKLPAPDLCSRVSRNPIDWICISACRSYQSNYEYKADEGRVYGRLSFALSTIFSPNITIEQLENKLGLQYKNMQSIHPQDPVIEYDTAFNKNYTLFQ